MISVSLLIPVYNHEDFLPELFESIWRQNCKSIQIVAVDDGSTDQSYDVLLECKARSPFEMIVLRKNNGFAVHPADAIHVVVITIGT